MWKWRRLTAGVYPVLILLSFSVSSYSSPHQQTKNQGQNKIQGESNDANNKNQKCNNGTEGLRNVSNWCPQPDVCPKTHRKCSKEGEVLGISMKAGEVDGGATCNLFYLVKAATFSGLMEERTNSGSGCMNPALAPTRVQVAFKFRVNDSFCMINVQSYEFRKCQVSSSPEGIITCTQHAYKCNEDYPSFIKDFKKTIRSTRSKGSGGGGRRLEPLPTAAHSKSPEILRKEELDQLSNQQHEPDNNPVTRFSRANKSQTPPTWRDYVLEIAVVSMIAVMMLLIGIKICMAEKLVNFSSHSRIVRFDVDEEKASGASSSFQSRRLSTFYGPNLNGSSSSPPTSNQEFRLLRTPSKPILKKGPNINNIIGNQQQQQQPSINQNQMNIVARKASNSISNNSSNATSSQINNHQHASSRQRHNKGNIINKQQIPNKPTTMTINTTSNNASSKPKSNAVIKSFDSNSSIYYDALECPEDADSSTVTQPLIKKEEWEEEEE